MTGTEMSLAEFDKLGESLVEVDRQIKELEDKVKALQEIKRDLSERVIFVMQQSNKTNYQVGNKKLILNQRASVQTPKTLEEKEAFFKWCEERGVYWQYASVNSQSLNALYKAERDAAAERQDLEWNGIPGVGKESIAYTVSIRS